MTETSCILTNGVVRLSFEMEGGALSGYTLDVRAGDDWRRAGAMYPVSQVTYRDSAGNRQIMPLQATLEYAGPTEIHLGGGSLDLDGVEWRFSARFQLDEHSNQIQVDYRLESGQARQALNWQGPGLLAGEGSYGAAKEEALFAGLEYLLDDEPSSDTRFAAEKFARRSVPHPYKITIPLMAISHAGQVTGMMWDPNQDWHSAWRHPAALFSSPNQITPGANNHYMALLAPAVEPRWRNDGELEAHTPCGVGPNSPFTLSARLFAYPEGGLHSALRGWVETYGLPPIPDPGHTYDQNVEMIVRSFLDVVWDESAEGWRHTLSDPWGPRFEPNLSTLLWRYGRWSEGDPLLQARARDQVQRAVRSAQKKNPLSAPHLDLALTFGDLLTALDAAAETCSAAIAEQLPDGSWPWKPADVQGGNLKTAERLALMGKDGDSATGFTATKARPVLLYALATGDLQAVDSLKRAVAWCNRQRRPEGAQAWELHLHVPDVLAAPYLIYINLGMYHLTHDPTYLHAAQRWAWTGLPFTYLWNGYYRPVMRYGTVPVFGVTFHDIQSWFGVIVQWNGLVYAEALSRLARVAPTDGPIDWRVLSEGITRHGMQEQITYGPHYGMYPDAFSPVRGDEEYTWWLNPQLIGLNSFPLAGLQALPDTSILPGPQGKDLHITSGAAITQATWVGSDLRLMLTDQASQSSYTLLAGCGQPKAVICEGQTLPEVTDLETAPQGWQWNDRHQTVIVKLTPAHKVVNIRVDW